MSQELWINDDQDYKDFCSFLDEEQIFPLIKQGEDADGNTIVKAGDLIVHVPKVYKLAYQEKNKYDPLIFGKDSTEGIVNITVDNEYVYIYNIDGTVTKEEYYNWAIGSRYDDRCQRLKGNQYYKYLMELPEDQFYGLKEKWNPTIWTPRTTSEGFMLRSGMTYYKGLKVNQVSLLSFDLEATSLNKDADGAYIPLLSTTYRSRTGEIKKKLFDVFDYPNYEAMWDDITAYVQLMNPDIILGHNILSYDLPYSDANSPEGLFWGRDGSRIIFDQKYSKFRKDGSQQYEYFNATINGREIIDTFFLSIKYDLGREFPSYGLKSIEKYLGLVKEDRSWDFNEWPVARLIEERCKGTKLGLQKWQEFREYCQDDSDSPIKMFDIMIPAFFYLCQSVPKTLQQVINEASGSQLDSLMIRSYLQDGYSLPKTTQTKEFEGAISMGIPGIYENVRKVDVASLYPSIMLNWNIYDKVKDPNRHMLKMLEYFRDERLKNKKLAKETGDRYFDDMQNAQKIMINSMYGFLGANFLLFNYPDGAEAVTRHGREILLKGVEWATGHTLNKVVKSIRNEGTEDEEEKFHWVLGDKVSEGRGYTLVNVDTDSFSYTDGTAPSKEEFKEQIKELNSLYPDLIKWEDDGVYQKIIVVKAKNYVLVKDGKEPKYKGSSLTDQKKEPALIELLEKIITDILNTNGANLQDLYQAYCIEALNPNDINRWCTKKTITKAIFESKRANETKVLDACNHAIKNGVIQGIQEGDKVYLYQAIDGMIQDTKKGELVFNKKGEPKMVENCILKFPQLYSGDHDQWHYVSRVYNTVKILENVVDIDSFTKYANKANQDELLELAR